MDTSVGTVARPATRRSVRYRDPAGRFELLCPAGWELHAEAAVQVAPRGRAAFARVDALPSSPWIWADVERTFVLDGLRLELARIGDREAEGEIQVGATRLRWRGFAHAIPGGVLVLSLGCAPAGDEAAIESIHRGFRVTADTSLG